MSPDRPCNRGAGRPDDGLPPLGAVVRGLGLSARKSLGQNFILDLNLTRRIARAAAPLKGHRVIEVGPGPGGLTRGLLAEGAAHVVAIERDPRCRPALDAIAERYPSRLTVVEEDALAVDYAALAEPPTVIVANLPYNIATALLVRWLSEEPWPPWYARMVLMFQKEVAERIVARPGAKSYGRLAVLAGWRTRARIVLTLPPRAFTPPPKVHSALVSLVPRETPEPACALGDLERVTNAAFGQRRKMLRASLRSLTSEPEMLLEAAAIDGRLRAEQLNIADFCRLARAFAALKDAGQDRQPR